MIRQFATFLLLVGAEPTRASFVAEAPGPASFCFCDYFTSPSHSPLFAAIGTLSRTDTFVLRFSIQERIGANAPPVGTDLDLPYNSSIYGSGKRAMMLSLPGEQYLLTLFDDEITLLGNPSDSLNGQMKSEFCTTGLDPSDLLSFLSARSYALKACEDEIYDEFPDLPRPSWMIPREDDGCSGALGEHVGAAFLALWALRQRASTCKTTAARSHIDPVA